MKRFKEMSCVKRLYCLVFFHFLINVITAIIFFVDDFSLPNQITHTVIHLSCFVLLIQFIYVPNKKIKLGRIKERIWIGGFILLNIIPFKQQFLFANNGFVSDWATFPQINFGLPLTYIRFFIVDLPDETNNPLLHLNIFFLNLYLCGLVTIVVLLIRRKILERRRMNLN